MTDASEAETAPDEPPLPGQVVLAAALLGWLCAAVTLLAVLVVQADRVSAEAAARAPFPSGLLLGLGHALRGPGGLVALGLLVASLVPFVIRPRSPRTALGYLAGGVLACLALLGVLWVLALQARS